MTLTFLYTNAHGAKIYGDPLDRVCVKVEDILTEFQPEPQVNYQGDRYIGRDGAMYLATTQPEEMDKLGKVPSKRPEVFQETSRMQRAMEPPSPINLSARQVNTIYVQRALTDDTSIGLYYMDDPESQVRVFYRVKYPGGNTLTQSKVLFVYLDEKATPSLTFLDRFKQNFEAITKQEARMYTYNGSPIDKTLPCKIKSPGKTSGCIGIRNSFRK